MRAVDSRLTLDDGRTLAWCEYGPQAGTPVLHFQGTPGSRYSRHADEAAYDRLSVRLIVFDRPGYGASTRLPGRGISVVVDDAAALLDHLGHNTVHASGGSGGGPHVLAFAARHPERARAMTVVVGGAPLDENDAAAMTDLNRAGWHAVQESWDAVRDLLIPVREQILADPLAGFRAAMSGAPPSDAAVMENPDWQRVLRETATEALRPGVDGWADEAVAALGPWDFEPRDAQCTITWWHGEHDANAPIAAVRRLLVDMPSVDLRVWDDGGHLAPYHRHDEILEELLSR